MTIELATARDLRWATGAMVLMVLLLCALLLVVFLNYQAADPVLIAKIEALSERVDRLQGELAAVRLREDSLRRDLQRLGTGGFQPLPGQPGTFPGAPGVPPNVGNPGGHPLNPNPMAGTGHTGHTGAGTPAANQPVTNHNAAPPANVGVGDNVPAGNLPPSNPLDPNPGTNAGPPPTDDPLLLALKASDPTQRLEALLDVNRHYERRAIPYLIPMVVGDSDPYVRALAIRILGAFRVREAGAALQEIVANAGNAPGIVADAARDVLRELDR